MFNVNVSTGEIVMSSGDTGEIPFRISGYDFSDLDYKVVFCARNRGKKIKEEYYTLDENGRFTVCIVNGDTDQIPGPAICFYDVTVVVDPVYDQGGKIVDGSFVRTLNRPTRMSIRPAERQI